LQVFARKKSEGDFRMSAFENIKATIAKYSSSYDRTHGTYEQLKTDTIKIQLGLKDEAINRGKKNLPPSNAENFDDMEQKIVTYINNHVKSAVEAYYDDMRSFEERMTRLNVASNPGRIQNIALAAEADFQTQLHKRKDALYTAKIEVTQSERDLENFKKNNGLTRSADYPKSKLWIGSVAAALLLIETGLNSLYFSQGSEMGLMGGLIIAGAPSLMNTILGMVLGGLALRLLPHIKIPAKILGIGLLISVVTIAITGNLLLAHYRSEMMAMTEFNVSVATTQALKSLRETPFVLNDVESWYLFAMGVSFFVGATFSFWRMDDRYLGYGNQSKIYKDKLNFYAKKKAFYLEELETLRNHNMLDLDEAAEEISAKASEANAVYDSKKRWEVLFQEHITHLENAGREMLGYYRTMNMGERTDKPPEYFQKTWNLERPKLPEPGIDFLKIVNSFQTEIAGVQTHYSESSQRLNVAYMEALKEYDTIDQLKPEELKKWQDEKGAAAATEKLATAA
jgi:hypothetical protein